MLLDLAPTSGLNIADMGMERMNRQYRIHEFAALAGVTAKALRHYERLGLLKPRRSASGYRLYAESDLERLEQIVALKFLGLPLKQIKGLLERGAPPIAEALRGQRAALEEKRQLLDRAITAIQDAERAMVAGTSPDAAILRRLIDVIERQNHLETMKRYYNEDAWTTLSRLRRQYTDDLRIGISDAWRDLFREAEYMLEEDPGGDKAQDLGVRWMRLWESTTGGDVAVRTGLRNSWADRRNWPSEMRREWGEFKTGKIGEFITKVLAAQMKKYYTAEAWARKTALDRPEIADSWRALYREAGGLLEEDPASEKARELATRWLRLSELSTGGDAGIKEGLKKAWEDRQRWPLVLRQYLEESRVAEIAAWIGKAIHELHKRSGPIDLQTSKH
jgi:MerR family transcriptional regulator, thiopeptide resistance regulator